MAVWSPASVYTCEILFHQDLIDDLKYELTGKFERLIVSLMRTPAYHDAKEIHDAIKVRRSKLLSRCIHWGGNVHIHLPALF